MWRLFYDEYTGQSFVAEDISLEANLNSLRHLIYKRGQFGEAYFKVSEYCKALGIPNEDPFDYAKMVVTSYDIPFLFQFDLSMDLKGYRVMKVSIAG